MTSDNRQDLVREALEKAVIRDKAAEQADIISRDISQGRVDRFVADVYATRFSYSELEQLFRRAGAFLYLPAAAVDAPEERGERRLIQRAPFVEAPGWAPVLPHATGPGLEDDVTDRFETALAGSPQIEVDLSGIEAVLRAFDLGIEALGATDALLILLSGDWLDEVVDLDVRRPADYIPRWEVHQQRNDLPDVALYKGHPVLVHRSNGARRAHLIVLGEWGCLVRAQVEGDTDLRVEVLPISEDRAREILSRETETADLSPRIRELQATVQVNIFERVGFRVVDANRAVQLVPGP